LLPILIDPVTAPADFGSKLIVRTAVCPGLSVTGVVTPESPKPEPAIEIWLMVRAAVPEDVSVTALVTVVFKATVPKASLLLLRVSAGVVALRLRAKVFEIPPEVAVRVTVWAAVTAVVAAVKPAVDAPDAIVTEAGTVTALELLANVTVVALVAAPLRLTVQASVPAPDNVELLQERPLRDGAEA